MEIERRPVRTRTLRTAIAALAVCLLAAPAHGALLDHGLRIEGERMLRPGMWRIGATVAVESEIKPGVEVVTREDAKVNVLRFPVSWRYGLSPKFECGADLQIEKDKGTTYDVATAFDGGGISYVDVIAKYKMFPWTTWVGRVGILGDKNLYGGGDSIDFGMDMLLTLPLNLPIGIPNLMHLNAGIRLKGGTPDIDHNGRDDVRGYNDPIHLGGSIIVVPLPRVGVVTEFYAQRSPFGLETMSEAALGVRYATTERTTVMASVAHGLSDGSPNIAFRFGVEATYGSMTERQVMRQERREKMPKELPAEGGGPQPLQISVERLASIAEAAYQRGDYLGAADAFSELVSRIPSDARIYYNLGVCYYNLKDYKRAEGEFLKAMTLMQNDPDVHLYLGHCQFLQGRVDEAKKNWEEVLRIDPSNELAKYLLNSSP